MIVAHARAFVAGSVLLAISPVIIIFVSFVIGAITLGVGGALLILSASGVDISRWEWEGGRILRKYLPAILRIVASTVALLVVASFFVFTGGPVLSGWKACAFAVCVPFAPLLAIGIVDRWCGKL